MKNVTWNQVRELGVALRASGFPVTDIGPTAAPVGQRDGESLVAYTEGAPLSPSRRRALKRRARSLAPWLGYVRVQSDRLLVPTRRSHGPTVQVA